ncbi:MAG TPA: radical SAM family heme chaperone HemW [Alphaproteobacteria bacterium]|nr:radical SAM family heme chaperone HemW [Alphaproteobacteria bacterium]
MSAVPRSRAATAQDRDAGFGVYVHWPFCLSKCPYCDFNSHVRERIDETRWRRALLAELDHYAERAGRARIVSSLFFGGGTPSLMAPETVATLIERVRAHWPVAADFEVTLEANPNSVEAGRFAGYAAAGVNRVSLGVQALEDEALRFLGRRHSAREALAALEFAKRHFARVSFDLIYARPGQTEAAWRAELARALALAGGHLSVYQLTIETGTVFEQAYARGDFALPEEGVAAELYEITQATLGAAGLPAYEISNHAAPGEESRHNLVYWRYGDYVGVGPGAHGRLTLGAEKIATRQHRAPEAWLERVERDGHATRQFTTLAPATRCQEMLMMGLRLREGVARARFRRETGLELEAALAPERLARLADGGFLELDAQALRATDAGRQRLNAVLEGLLA